MKRQPFSRRMITPQTAESGMGDTGGFSYNIQGGLGPMEPKKRKKRAFSTDIVKYGERYKGGEYYHRSVGWY